MFPGGRCKAGSSNIAVYTPHTVLLLLLMKCVLCVFLLGTSCVRGAAAGHHDDFEKVSSESDSLIQRLRAALSNLDEEAKSYLGKVAGEQTVISVQKAFSQVLGVFAAAVASGVNVLTQHLAQFLQAAGLDGNLDGEVSLPFDHVTPEGVIFVGQWLALALVGYWLASLAYRLVASTVRRAVWLLKVAAALAAFGLILSDRGAGTETMAVRLAALVCACVLLGIGPSNTASSSQSGGAPALVDKTARLEETVRILERRVKEMERWRRIDDE